MTSSQDSAVSLDYNACFQELVEQIDYPVEYHKFEEMLNNINQYQNSNYKATLDNISSLKQSVEEKKLSKDEEVAKRAAAIRLLMEEIPKKKCNLKKLQEEVSKTDHLIQELEIMNKEVNEQQKKKLSRAEKAVEMFSSYLGIVVTAKRNGIIIFTFTQICRRDPQKKYFVEVSLEADKYKLVSTCPEIPNLVELQEKFEQSKELITGLLNIRRQFVQKAKEEYM